MSFIQRIDYAANSMYTAHFDDIDGISDHDGPVTWDDELKGFSSVNRRYVTLLFAVVDDFGNLKGVDP